MTGRELIIYILQNGLEDKPVFENHKLIAHFTVEEFAVRCGVGQATVYAWILGQRITPLMIGTRYYIPVTTVPPNGL